jgi:hypothetical protein
MIEVGPKKRIVWLASYPQSGNNWARAFLFSLFNVFRNAAVESVDLRRMDEFSVPDNSLLLYKRFLQIPPQIADRKTIASLRPKVFEAAAQRARGAVLIKTHNARIDDNGTPFIDDGLTAGAIYVIRNPLDVAVSFAAARRTTIDQVIADMASPKFGRNSDAISVYTVCGSWSSNVKSWVDHQKAATLTVRFEDMRDQPEATFGKIAEHMQMKPSADQLRKAIVLATQKKAAAEARAGAGGWGGAAAQDQGWGAALPKGEQQSPLTPNQVKRIVSDHGRLMERFGYPT